MGHRNVLCTHQMLDVKLEQGLSYLHPNHLNQYGEVGDYPNQQMYAVQSTAGSATGLDPRFAGHHGGNLMFGTQQYINQYFHPPPNIRLGGPAASNVYHPYMLAPSSSSSSVPLNNGSASLLPSLTNHRDTGVAMDEYATSDNLGHFCKRKDIEVVPGSFYHFTGPPNLCLPPANLSVSSEPLQWGQRYKYPMPFIQPENQGMVICPTINGADRIVSGSSSVSLPLEPAFPHHHNIPLQRNYSGQPSQPSNSAWVEQFGNHFVDAGCSNSNYADQMAYMHGTPMNSGAVEIPNLGMQKYQDMSSNRGSGFVIHHPAPPNFYQHPPPMQNMAVNTYSHHSQTPLPSYSHIFNNMHANNVYPPRVDVASDSSFQSSFNPISDRVNIPSMHEAAPEIIHESFRVLSEDAAAALQIPRFYGFEEIPDQHRDMRLDIDDMSYEELLALEEHIGVVNTGLPEESILKNLKTSARSTKAKCSELDQSSETVPENENCIVCQVEYEENESIGTLECGHRFHADCIKQWLLVKNLCPICKKPALSTDRRSE